MMYVSTQRVPLFNNEKEIVELRADTSSVIRCLSSAIDSCAQLNTMPGSIAANCFWEVKRKTSHRIPTENCSKYIRSVDQVSDSRQGTCGCKSTMDRQGTLSAASGEPLTMDSNLVSGWKWLKYTGLHPDLLMISIQQNRMSQYARYLFTLILQLLLNALAVFEFVQLVVRIGNGHTMVEIVPDFIYTNYIILFIVWRYQKRKHHHAIVELFNDWKQVEKQSKSVNLTSIKKAVNGYYVLTFMFSSTILISVFTRNLLEPQRSFFMSHYSVVRETFGVVLLSVFQSVFAFYTIILLFIEHLFPLLFFYHSDCAVDYLVEEWDTQWRNIEYLRVIWEKYERILHLVDRANKLFGTVLIMTHLHFIFIFCLMIFSSIVQNQESTRIRLTSLITTTVVVLGLLTLNWMLSQLYFSTKKMKKVLCDVQSQEWFHLDEAKRELLVSFQRRTNKNLMSVRPLNLFTVNPTNFLSIVGVILNYVVVLAQSR